MNLTFFKGIKDGIPIALGYLSVSFGFGILAVKCGLSANIATIISMTNLTSAGQTAGAAIIAAGGTYLEMAITQLIINIRYSLMGLSLSQKLDSSFTITHRLIASFGITDEIFAVASMQKNKITPKYIYGLIIISFIGWSVGTYMGASAGKILPHNVINSMGIALYGMFLAIIIPPSKKSMGVLTVIIMSAAVSTLFKYLATFISAGFSIIICAVFAAIIGAVFFPIDTEGEQ